MYWGFQWLYTLAQGNFNELTCGAEFEMITLDKDKDVPLNRTMISVSDKFVIDDDLSVGYGRHGKYYNTVWLINYTLRAHRAELKSSYHVDFKVPPAVSEDEAFLEIHIMNINGQKIGTIIPDGLSYMPEIVTAAWLVTEVKRRSTLIRSLIEFAVEKLDGRIADRQLPYVLGNYDMIDTIAGIPAKKDPYYRTLVEGLAFRWKKFAQEDEQWIRALWQEMEPDLEFPLSLLHVKDCIGENILKKRWFAHNVSTTSHHLHISWSSLKETVDMFIAVMYYEGKVRHDMGVAYFEQLGKGYMRHIAFGSLIALRYWMSKKSKKYLEEKWYDWRSDNFSDEIIQDMQEKHLLLPPLRVSSPLSNGRDPEGSLACKIYQTAQEAIASRSWRMIAEQKVLQLIGKKFFARPEDFIDAYTMWKDTINQWILRSHSDIVLKVPMEREPGQYILTMEMRGQDYPPLMNVLREETREAYVIQNNLLLLQKSAQQFTECLQSLS